MVPFTFKEKTLEETSVLSLARLGYLHMEGGWFCANMIPRDWKYGIQGHMSPNSGYIEGKMLNPSSTMINLILSKICL
jgi:hypothetical protein